MINPDHIFKHGRYKGRSLLDVLNSNYTVDPSSGCWVWSGRVGVVEGYPRLNLQSKETLAHRLVAKFINHDDIDGKAVMHTCDNPSCINPKHLKVGTWADNNGDRASKHRSYVLFGSSNTNSKLSCLDAVKIRLYAKTFTQRFLGKVYGVDKRVIHNIVTGKSWVHV